LRPGFETVGGGIQRRGPLEVGEVLVLAGASTEAVPPQNVAIGMWGTRQEPYLRLAGGAEARLQNPVRRKVFRAAWFKALKDAGIKKHVRPGWLRHSGASLAYAATRDLKLVSKRLGHTSTRMVDSTYAVCTRTLAARSPTRLTSSSVRQPRAGRTIDAPSTVPSV
jgi:hypothetical protein